MFERRYFLKTIIFRIYVRFRECTLWETGVIISYGPIGSIYGIFTHIWLICMVNVGIYTMQGSSGLYYILNQTIHHLGEIYQSYRIFYICVVGSSPK